MSSLIRLPQPAGTVTPQALPVGIRANGLTQELVCAWSSQLPLLNLVNGAPFALTGAGLSGGLTDKGSGLFPPATGYLLQSLTSGPTSKTEFSSVVVCAPLNDGASHFALSLGDAVGASGNYVLFGHELNSVQQASLKIYTGSYQNLLGASTLPPQNTATNAPAATAVVLGMTNSVTRNVRQIWVDGRIDASSTGVTSGAAHHNVITLLANANSGVQWMGGPVLLILVWNRALSESELVSISAAPWSALRYPTRRIYGSHVTGSGSAQRSVAFFAT